MSVTVVATILPRPEHHAEVLTILAAAVPQVHDEPGCELYTLNVGNDRMVIVEKWESPEALAAHNRGPVLAAAIPQLQGKLLADLEIHVLEPHPVGDPVKGAL